MGLKWSCLWIVMNMMRKSLTRFSWSWSSEMKTIVNITLYKIQGIFFLYILSINFSNKVLVLISIFRKKRWFSSHLIEVTHSWHQLTNQQIYLELDLVELVVVAFLLQLLDISVAVKEKPKKEYKVPKNKHFYNSFLVLNQIKY